MFGELRRTITNQLKIRVICVGSGDSDPSVTHQCTDFELIFVYEARPLCQGSCRMDFKVNENQRWGKRPALTPLT
jgi:hypothetical protein